MSTEYTRMENTLVQLLMSQLKKKKQKNKTKNNNDQPYITSPSFQHVIN